MRRSISALLLFVVSLAAPSAFAQPRPGAPPAQPPAPASLPPAVEVSDPMLAPLPRPKTEVANWDEALKHIRARSTDLRIAAQEIARAEAQSRIALAGALTTINGTGTLTHNLIRNEAGAQLGGAGIQPLAVPQPNIFVGVLSASQPVLALRAWYNIGTASHNETAAALTLEDTKRVIALNVANAMVGVVTAERIAELNRVGLRNALTRLELANRRSTLGSGTGLDVVRARQDVETARATLVAGDESLRQAREALGLALGLPEQVGVPPSVDMNGLEANARSSCKAVKSVDERPDVAALQERQTVARRLTTDAKLQFMPTIDLRSQVQTTAIADTGVQPNTLWSISGVLTVPIWDGGIRYGNMRDTNAQLAIAGEKLEAQRRKATIEVAQAQRAVAVAEDRKKVAAQTRDLAAENDRLTRTAYLEGRGTSLELVTAAQGLREAEIQLAVREFELVKARIAAILALASCPW